MSYHRVPLPNLFFESRLKRSYGNPSVSELAIAVVLPKRLAVEPIRCRDCSFGLTVRGTDGICFLSETETMQRLSRTGGQKTLKRGEIHN